MARSLELPVRPGLELQLAQCASASTLLRLAVWLAGWPTGSQSRQTDLSSGSRGCQGARRELTLCLMSIESSGGRSAMLRLALLALCKKKKLRKLSQNAAGTERCVGEP